MKRPLTLRKVLRSANKAALAEVLTLAPDVVRVEDTEGRCLVGEAVGQGVAVDIVCGERTVGRVVGGESSVRVASLLAWMYGREQEKRDLATETLGRYKELTLLYDMGEKLSRELELGEVARAVLEDAQQHLGATGGALYLHDMRHDTLEAAAWVGGDDLVKIMPADKGVAGQAFRSGRAVFIDAESGIDDSLDTASAIICAPLRVGERVIGVIRLWQEGLGWTAGDLKLVTALAANASSALAAAQLHARRVRELALLHQLERHVSPELLYACYGDDIPDADQLVVACCDVRSLASVKGAERVEHVVLAVEGGRARAIRAFLEAGATVDTPQDLVLGLFAGPEAAARAVAASERAMEEVADFAPTGLGMVTPGVGIATAPVRGEATGALYKGINSAAVLQSESDGRVLVDATVAAALGEGRAVALGPRELPSGESDVYELRRAAGRSSMPTGDSP